MRLLASVARARHRRLLRHPVGADVRQQPTAAQQQPPVVDFDFIQAKARKLARQPYQPAKQPLPSFLADLNYDQYRDLRFKPEQSLWREQKLPIQAQFLSRGFSFDDRVLVNIVDAGKGVPLRFQPAMFDFGRLPVPNKVPGDLGFAGLRLHYPLNTRDYFDELLVFQGASYFRAVGRDEVYGLSARGLALNTGIEGGEEFPVFREFWLLKPAPEATAITFYALLDSPSVSGAYQFVAHPGRTTDIEVSAHLYFRKAVEKVGLAPLTSMFFYAEAGRRSFDDFRPEVHDSDGLLIAGSNGDRVWRPLSNPRSLSFSSFSMENPRGFALLQRDRDFDHYQDLEAEYHRRPSAWVEPSGNWGKGAVELMELPTDSETYDNIAAFGQRLWVSGCC